MCVVGYVAWKALKMRVKAVLFDLFDTLVLIEGGDSFYMPSLEKLHKFLVKNGVNVSFEEFSRVYFEVRDQVYEEAKRKLEEPHFNVRVSRTLKRLGYNLEPSDAVVSGATMVFAKEFMSCVRLDENTIPVLQRLRGKYKLGIVSNFAIPECVQGLLDRFGLDGFFDVVVISGAVNRRKPSPEIFQKALKALSVDASETVFVGDTPNMDVKGAKNVGMKAVLIERKTAVTDSPDFLIWKPSETERPVEPDKVIRSLNELPDVLKDC
jgi:HAD superfamily hydrolase (TIGR01662 family)